MKNRSLFLILLLAVFAPWTTSFAQQTMTIGTGTNYALSGNYQGNSSGSPFGNCYYYNSTAQFIYTAEELNGAKTITSVAFNHNGNSFNANVNIYLFHTTASTVAINDPVTAGTPVYTGSGIAVGGSSAGWQTFQLTTPFEYNGNDNLLVVVCRTNSGNGWSSNIGWQYTATTDNKYMVRSSDTDNYGYITNTNNYTASTSRPNIQIGYQTTDPYISLAPASETVLTGFTKTLTATYGNVTGTPTITYTSSNVGVATVSGNGTTATVTGIAPGNATITATMNYQGTDYTATAAITVEDPSYCEPYFSSSASYGIYITNFTTEAGINNSTGFSTGGYGDYYDSHSAEIEPGEALDFTVSHGSQWDCGFAIWVDWNKDYEFSADERVAATSAMQTTSWSGSFSVPSATAVGDYRMRVLMQYNTSSPSNPCVSAYYGEGEDYKLTVIAPGNCPKPRTLAASNVAVRTATLTWTMDSPLDATAVGFNVEYKKAADPDEPTYWTRVGTAYDLLTTTISGLTPETEYTARVQAACGNNEYSDWRNIAENFTTGIACPAPTALAVTEGSVTASEATVTWEGTSSDGYVVMIGEENLLAKADFETGDLSQADFTTTSSYPWTVVANNHSGAYCAKSGNGGVNSSTSDMMLEVTLANDATLTFSAKVSSEATYDKAYFSIDGTPQSDLNGISGNGAWIDYIYSLTAGTHTLRWYYTKDNSEYSNDDCFYVDDIVVSAGVSSWTEHTIANLTYTFENLAANTGYQVRVKGNCGDDGYSTETAPVSFTTPDDCPNPGKPTESEVTAHSAVISWEGNGLTEFNLEYIYAGYNEWFSMPGVTSPCTIEGLPASTEIQVRVQGTCDAANNEWSETLFFMTDVSCPVPTNVRITEGPTAHGVTIEWDAEEGEMFQYVMLHGTPTDFSSVAWDDPRETNTASWNILYADYDWTFAIRKYCGESDQSEVVSLTFTTLVACPAPTDLADNNVTNHSADLSWNGTSESYNVMYRTAAYMSDPVLNEEFKTTTLPTDWGRSNTALTENVLNGTTSISSTTSGWVNSSYGLGQYNWKMNIYQTSKYWLITKNITLGNNSTLNFDAAITAYNSDNAPTAANVPDANSRFVVLITTDNQATWSILREWNNTGSDDVLNNISNTANNFSIDLSSYAGETVKIAFYGGQTVSGPDCDLHIDNVIIGEPIAAGPWQTVNPAPETSPVTLSGLLADRKYEAKVQGDCGSEGLSQETTSIFFTTDIACPNPTNLQVVEGSIKSNQVDLTWESTYGEIWEVIYWPTADPNSTITLQADHIPYTLNYLLSPSTEYTVKVRSWCGDDDDWSTGYSNEVSFTTLEACFTPYEIVASNITSTSANLTWTGESDEYNIEYWEKAEPVVVLFEGFENADDYANWQAFGNVNTNTGNRFGRLTTAPKTDTYHFSFSSYSQATDYNQYLISPEVNAGGGNLEFYYRMSSGSSAGENFEVGYSTSGNTVSDFTWFEPSVTCTSVSYQKYSKENLPAGTKYIAIHYFQTTDRYQLFIDDIKISKTSVPSEVETATSTTEYVTLEGLDGNKTYEVRVQGVCDGTTGDWSDIFEFTTLVPSFTKDIEAYNTTEDKGWYLIASPLAETNITDVEGLIETDPEKYSLYRFNENPDIVNGIGLEWENYQNPIHTDFTTLENGHGYLYANANGTTLTFTGMPLAGTEPVGVTLQKNEGAEFAGWNLVGNPFAVTAYIGKSFYTMNEDNRKEIITEPINRGIAPMEGVFVQADNDGETLTFSTTRPESNAGALNINVMQAAANRGNRLIDRAILSFGEGQTLAKFQLNANSTKVYIPQNGKDYAVVSAEAAGEVPVNFRAEKNGSYTLSFSNTEVTFSYLRLIDNMTGADIDLLETPSYTFNAQTTDYESRFKLVFATGSSTSSDTFAFYSNGNWVISNDGDATLQVIDVTGRVLSSERISGSCSKAIQAAPGVYMLRLINGDNVKTQKVVVR